MTITVNVNDDDCTTGYQHPLNCPVAKALYRVTGVKWWVWATTICCYDRAIELAAPQEVQDAVARLDWLQRPVHEADRRNLEPFSFEIDIPQAFFDYKEPPVHAESQDLQ